MRSVRGDFCREIPQSGSYLLLIHLKKDRKVSAGKMGRLKFFKGFYIYAGRGLRALPSRIERHLRKRKQRVWHIDYLTSLREAEVVDVFISDNPMFECQFWKHLVKDGWVFLHHGFGSSDCKNSCPSHLLYSPTHSGKIPFPSCFLEKLDI